MNTKTWFAALAICAVSAAGGYAYSKRDTTINSVLQAEHMPLVKTNYTAGTSSAPVDFEKAASAAVPSVVHIKTTMTAKRVSRQQQQLSPDDFFGGDDMFRRFFGGDGRSFSQPDQKASGSGVIISSDGYIVTNNHVVDGATEIYVTLNDRKTYKAKLVGADANTDLALIKVDAKNLAVMPVGNSDDVRLGQWVLAIGYPLNLDVTVTQGIVSAKSRNIGINRQGTAPVEAFIQTDAAVNPGSSGGALVNTNGELVGINAAIASPTGAYAGYAYSIPSNLMKKVIGDIMKYGSVQRGYLGVTMAPAELDDKQKKELGINDDIAGVWVAETDPQGAAAAAGIQKGDAITKINGVAVTSPAQLAEQIARQKPGDKISVTLLRGQQEKTVNAVLKGKMGSFASQQAAAIESLGAKFNSLSKEDAAKLQIDGGVQVTDIQDGILSNQTNMREGFVITKLGDTKVRNVEELRAAIAKAGANFQLQGIYPGSDEIYFYGINDFKN